MALTMMQKRDDFATYMQSLLVVHDASFTSERVDTTEREELEINSNRKNRVKIMGEDARYAYVHDIGQQIIETQSGLDAAGNICAFIGHRFRVGLLWQKDYATSQDAFEAAVYNDRDNAKPGLLDSIRANRTRIVSGEAYEIGAIGQDPFINIIRDSWDFAPLGGTPELAHYLQFEVLLIG